MFYVSEIYALAVQIEKNGESFYREASRKVSSPQLRSLLEYLADEEVKHIETFTQKKEAFHSEKGQPALDEAGSAVLQEILGGQRFSLEEVNLSEMEKAEDFLQMALEFERDTILFFELIGSFIEDADTLEKLNEIIEEENRHIKLLEDYRTVSVESA
jgi:rubrerythrin